MTSYYQSLLHTIPGRDIRKPRPGRNLAHLPFFDEIMANVDRYDELKRQGRIAEARAVKEAGMSRIDAWYDDYEARYDLEVLQQELLTAQREHAGRTALAIDSQVGF